MIKHTMMLVLLAAIFSLAGCSTYKNVPPNDIGMMLTPTGYEEKIYTPGQADVGPVDWDGEMNRLVLLQRSGVEIKEQFFGKDASDDKEDHRCLTGDKSPVTLDVRLLLALPDYETPSGKKDLARIFLLGNPEVVQGTDDRVLRISAERIYAEQAQQAVRSKIRQIVVRYPSYNVIFAAFGDDSDDGLTKRIEHAIASVLVERNIPLRLVSAFPSNMKPDPSVVDAIAALQAAEKRVQAIRTLTDFLDEDRTGNRRIVYQMQTWQEIVAKGNANGHNTLLFSPGAFQSLGR